MRREDGYYRIQLKNKNWIIAEWVNNGASSGWFTAGKEEPFDDEEIELIGDRVVFLCGWGDERVMSEDTVVDVGRYKLISTDCGNRIDVNAAACTHTFCPCCGGVIRWR